MCHVAANPVGKEPPAESRVVRRDKEKVPFRLDGQVGGQIGGLSEEGLPQLPVALGLSVLRAERLTAAASRIAVPLQSGIP